MTQREFLGLVIAEIMAAKEKKDVINDKIAKAKEIVDNPRVYSKDFIRDAEADIYSLRRTLDEVDEEHVRNVHGLCEKMREKLNEEMQLHGEDIHAEDAKLLGFDLNEQEFVTLLNRHDGNPTMQQLILKAAKKQGVDLGLRFVGNEAKLHELAGIEQAAAVAMRHSGNENVFSRLFGPESQICKNWNTDDRQRPNTKEAIGFSDDRVANAVRLLSGPDHITESVQRDIIKEFSERPGILAILKNAALRGNKYGAAAAAESYISGDFDLTGGDMEQRKRWSEVVMQNPLTHDEAVSVEGDAE